MNTPMTRSRLVLGTTLTLLGGLLLADQAGLVDAWAVLRVGWPSVILLAGSAQVLTRPRNLLGAAVTVTIGTVLLAWTLGGIGSPVVIWPLLLIGLGAWLLFGRGPRPTAAPTGGGSRDVVALFDRRSLRPTGTLTDGSATAVFDDVRLDLTGCVLEPDGARWQLTSVFGDIDLDLPANCRVEVTGPELLGDVRWRGPVEPASDPEAPVLRLRVCTVFGDVDLAPTGVTTTAGAAD
ncbi:MAG: hypothetical protein JJT89_00730 [Nitriliruptoraceae bacterium]|nr:hypothetical protein [Nitriliruptoraceae bacterium]